LGGGDSQSFYKKIEAAVKQIVRTEYGRKMFDKTPRLVVTEMSNNNEWGYTNWNTYAYLESDVIHIGKFHNLDSTLVHEIAHYNNYIECDFYEDGITPLPYNQQRREKYAIGQEHEYARSPFCDTPAITSEMLKEEEQRRRQAEMRRQSEEAMRNMQTSSSNLFGSSNSNSNNTVKTRDELETDNSSNKIEQENIRNNSEQTWGGLFNALFSFVSGNNQETENRERERSGNPERPNFTQRTERIDKNNPHLDKEFLRYVADLKSSEDKNSEDYFTKGEKNASWFKTPEMRRIVADYYQGKRA